MVEHVAAVVATAGKDAEVVIVWIGRGATVEGNHVGPDLEHRDVVGIVNHVGRIATTRTHVDLQCYEVAHFT